MYNLAQFISDAMHRWARKADDEKNLSQRMLTDTSALRIPLSSIVFMLGGTSMSGIIDAQPVEHQSNLRAILSGIGAPSRVMARGKDKESE
jgi:hypothetical protein